MPSSILLLLILAIETQAWVNPWKYSILPTSSSNFWKRKAEDEEEGSILKRGVSATGRVFVTMFGYPSKCENLGKSHSCTLSLACWMVGGQSQSGCGANPWLVACCVTSKPPNPNSIPDPPPIQKRIDNSHHPETKEGICGLSSDRILSKRIIGGREAKFGQFPWQAYIKINNYQCGGVLISSKFVATAAHCILTAILKDIQVYLGELDTQDTGKIQEPSPAELHRVHRRIIHPKFKFRLTQPDRYDLALLQLLTPTTFSFHILPICLPPPNLNLAGRTGIVAGWGKIQPSNELLGTNILRSASVPILDIQECIAWHRSKQIQVELHEEMLCAGHKNGKRDACLGDSGGPLIVLHGGRWTLAGIISAGFGCGEAQQPGIYHKVSLTTDWIKSVVFSL